MNSLRIAGISCLVVAVLLYLIAAAATASGFFAFYGFVFEGVAWSVAKQIPDNTEKKSVPPPINVTRRWR